MSHSLRVTDSETATLSQWLRVSHSGPAGQPLFRSRPWYSESCPAAWVSRSAEANHSMSVAPGPWQQLRVRVRRLVSVALSPEARTPTRRPQLRVTGSPSGSAASGQLAGHSESIAPGHPHLSLPQRSQRCLAAARAASQARAASPRSQKHWWDPSRGRGVDLTPMSLIQLCVYFRWGDIFKT